MNTLLAGAMAASLAATLASTVPLAAEGMFIPGEAARVHRALPDHDFDSGRRQFFRGHRKQFDRNFGKHPSFRRDDGDRFHDGRFDDRSIGTLPTPSVLVQPEALRGRIAGDSARTVRVRPDRDFGKKGSHRGRFDRKSGDGPGFRRHLRDPFHDGRFEGHSVGTFPVQVQPGTLPARIAAESARIRRSDDDFDGKGRRNFPGGHPDRFDRKSGWDRSFEDHDGDPFGDDRFDDRSDTARPMTVEPDALPMRIGGASGSVR